MTLRSPICTVVGHVDHGKSSILDRIRGTSIIKSEAGAITQAIGASVIPLPVIQKICGSLMQQNIDFSIPGLLFIDTPGHAAFTNLRKRGGNLADIAILVIDINEGLKPQTIESIEILKQYKTPFIIAANKIDLLPGWKKSEKNLIENINSQDVKTVEAIEKKLYEIVGKLAEYNLQGERFDRVDDYSKQVAIVPTSASTGEGIPELLMVLAGLAQKYLDKTLRVNIEGVGKGIVLEVKEEKGIGKSMDVIIYDGSLKVNDNIIIGGLNEPIVTKIRGLFEPAPLSEMRDKKAKFKSVKEVNAATGVKIAAPDIEDVVSGMPILQTNDIEAGKKEVQKEVDEVIMETDQKGIVIKADSLGSLEALLKLLKEANMPIRKANIGNITKKDISDAATNFDDNPFNCVVLGFNVGDNSGICDDKVKVITSPVIYEIIDLYKEWIANEKRKKEASVLDKLIQPAKMEVMKGYIFRQSNPAIVGAEIILGTLKTNTPVMNKKGKELSTVKSIQADKESVDKAEKGKQVAISLPNITVGRQLNEGDILYSSIPEDDFRKFKELKDLLSADQKMILKEIAEIKRENYVVWGI